MSKKNAPKLIVDFLAIANQRRQRQLRPNIRELVGQEFIIYNVNFGVGKKGEYAIVETDRGEYFSMSKTLIDQLRAIDEYFAEHNIDGVFVKLVERQSKNDPSRKYLTFISPTGGDEE